MSFISIKPGGRILLLATLCGVVALGAAIGFRACGRVRIAADSSSEGKQHTLSKPVLAAASQVASMSKFDSYNLRRIESVYSAFSSLDRASIRQEFQHYLDSQTEISAIVPESSVTNCEKRGGPFEMALSRSRRIPGTRQTVTPQSLNLTELTTQLGREVIWSGLNRLPSYGATTRYTVTVLDGVAYFETRIEYAGDFMADTGQTVQRTQVYTLPANLESQFENPATLDRDRLTFSRAGVEYRFVGDLASAAQFLEGHLIAHVSVEAWVCN